MSAMTQAKPRLNPMPLLLPMSDGREAGRPCGAAVRRGGLRGAQQHYQHMGRMGMGFSLGLACVMGMADQWTIDINRQPNLNPIAKMDNSE